MTQSFVTPYVAYATDGIQTTYAYPFKISLSTDLEVYKDGAVVTNYTVTGVGADTGGNIVFLAPPAAGVLFIRRVTPQTQTTDYVSNDAFTAASHEDALDKLTREVQDIKEELSRRVAFDTWISSTFRDLKHPTPVALKLIGWNSVPDALTLYDPSIVQVTPSSVAGLAYAKTSVSVTPSGGELQLTASTVFPAGSIALGATVYVATAFGVTNSLSGLNIGIADDDALFGENIGITLATTSNVGQFNGWVPFPCPSAVDVLITSTDTGLFDATGNIIVTGHSLTMTPDTSV